MLSKGDTKLSAYWSRLRWGQFDTEFSKFWAKKNQ